MARSRDIEYRVGFSSDVSQLEAAVKKATDSLNKLGTSPDKLRLGLDGAARSALELSNHLSTAFNQNTGKLDLIKFRQQLDANGRSLEAYATDLRKLGPEGEQAFLEMASAIGKAELPLRRTNNIVKQFGVTLWNTARWRITTSAINTFVGGLQQAYGYSKSLDASLNSIRIVTKKSADDMAQFAKQANAAAKTLSTTTTAYTDASLIFYQQGLSDEQVAARTETTIKMANVTGQAAEDISSQMTAIWNNFEDGSKSLENYADSIVALGASTAASSKEIAEGLQKFAPIAETVGLSFDYASATLTTIVQNTRESATAAGTSLKTLFSRLEGLKLGETLDDGTDLNKYSNALMAVGINIKDASGQLKDMDSILDELGAKWKTLARDQQMALAETVGGVRQYAQLVALMDNWSDFQKNLVTSRTADGELQKQADIYAESWEAARNRVKAASEDIYDSLINPEQFIKLDNLLTPFLTGVASAVDALGGLTGMIPIIISLMNQAFGDKIAQSMRNMVANIGLMTGAEQAKARALQENISQISQELNLTDAADDISSRKIEILKQEVSIQGELNSKIDSMSQAQRDQVDVELKVLSILKEKAIETAKIADANRQAVLDARDALAISANATNGINQPFGNISGQPANTFLSTNFMTNVNASAVRDFGGAVDSLIDKLEQIVKTSGQLRVLRAAFTDVKDVTQENITAAQNLLQQYGRLPANRNNVDALKQGLIDLTREANSARASVEGALRHLNAGSREIRAFTAAVNDGTVSVQNSETAFDNLVAGAERAKTTIRDSVVSYWDFADVIVKLGSAISSTAIMLRSFQTVAEAFSPDSTLSSTEKLIQTLMSLGMVFPILTRSFNEFTTMLSASQKIVGLQKQLNFATDSVEATRNALRGLAQGTPQYAAAWSAYTNATTSATAAQEALNKAMLASKIAAGVVVAVIGAVIAAIALYLRHQQKLAEERKKQNEAAVQAIAKAKEEAQSIHELVTAYQELVDTADDTLESKEAIAQKATEVAKALGIEGAALANLTGDYTAFNAAVAKASKQAAQKEYISAANEIATIDRNLSYEKPVLGGQNPLGVIYGHRRLNEGEQTWINYLESNVGRGIVKEVNKAGNETSYKADTSSLEKRFQAIQLLQNFIADNQFKTDNDIFGIEAAVKSAQTNLDKLTKSVAEYEDAYNNFLVAKATAEAYSVEPQYYKDFKQWKADTQEGFEAVGKSASEAEALISDVITNLGYEEWERIYELESSVIDKLRDFPTIIQFIKDYLNNPENEITPETVETLAQMSWGMVGRNDDGSIDMQSYQQEFSRTEERIALQKEGAQAALDYANAEKFLQQVQSKSGLKAKDLEGFEDFFSSREEFAQFLQTAGDEQTRWANLIIQRFYNNEIQKQEDLKQQLETAIEDTEQELKKLSKYSTPDQIELYSKEQQKKTTSIDLLNEWFDNRGDYLKQGVDKLAEFRQDIFSSLEKSLSGRGFSRLSIWNLLLGDQEVGISKINNAFEPVLDENVGRVIELTGAVKLYNDQLKDAKDNIELIPAMKIGEEIEIAESAKSLGELNKQYRLRNIGVEAYNKGIVKLAKSVPGTTATLKKYNEALSRGADGEEDAAKYLGELRKAVEDSAWGEAFSNIKTLNDELAATGSTLKTASDSINPKTYEEKLGKIAKSLNEVFGFEFFNVSKVQENADDILGILAGEENALTSIYNKIDFAQGVAESSFSETLSTLGYEANEIQTIVDALDLDFNINGYANVDPVIERLQAVGYTASEIAAILTALGNSNIGFEVEGLGALQAIRNANPAQYESLYGEGSYVADLAAATANLKIKGNTISSPGGGYYNKDSKGGGGGNKDKSKDDDELEDRYHEINRQLERQDRILDKLGKTADRAYGTERLKIFGQEIDELNTKLDLQQQKADIAWDYLQKDQQVIAGLDPENTIFKDWGIEFGPGQEIKNYNAVLERIVKEYNDAVTAEGYENLSEEAKKEIDDLYQHRQDWIKKYEDSLDNVNTMAHDVEETLRRIEDLKLEAIKYKVEVAIDIRDARKQMREFSKSIEESFGDMVTHGIKAAKAIQTATEGNISDEIAMLQTYTTEYAELQERLANATDATDINAIVDELKNLESNIISSGEALLEWLETVENMYADTLKDAADRFEAFTDQIAHDTDIIGMIKELYALQGVTYKTQENYYKLQKASQGEYTGYMRQAQLNRTWYEKSQAELAKYEEEIKKLRNTINTTGLSDAEIQQKLEEDVRYDALKKSRDALVEESNKAQKAMLENAQSAMETARQIYLDAIDKYAYDVEQRLSRGLGFDLLQDKYDHFIEKSERYLDPIEEGLEATTWYSKLDADIQQTSNKAYQDKLKALRAEVDVRRQNLALGEEAHKLSQYDLDIIEARYQVLQAEMALEDAKNNKNTLRLVRDSQGNWNYQYTANPDEVAAKEQELLGARKNEYEITKNRYKELNDELLKMTQEWAEKDKKIRQDVANGLLTEAEGQKRLEELQNFYTQKAEYLKTELDIAVEDMQTAATTSADLVSSLSENAYDTTDNMMRDLKNSFTSYLDEMSGYLIQNFEPAVVEYVGHAEAAFTTFKGQIQETANAIGVNPDSLDAMVSTLTSDMNSLYSEADQATRALWDQLAAVRELQVGYQQLMVDVMNAVRAMEQLNGKVVGSIETARGTLDSNDDNQLLPYVGDLSQQMAAALYNSYINKDELNKFSQLAQQRQEAIAGMTGVMTNDELMIKLDDADRELLKAYATGQAYIQVDSDLDTDKWKEIYGKTGAPTVMIASGATGMYTGEFEGGKLGILHQKELVLNAEDTKNMLAAVEVVRGLQDSVFATIGKTLDGNAAAAYAMLGSSLGALTTSIPAGDTNKTINIGEVNFPNAIYANEIEEAINNLINHAEQYAGGGV